jgi:Zn-dependent protease with chaperone function
MNIKTGLASIITLGVISSFVLSIFLGIAYFYVEFPWYWLIIAIIGFNFIMWLVSPWIADWMYKWFYKMHFYSYEEVKNTHYGKFMKKICDKYKIPVPKVGIIDDRNPTAFTYGSGAWNARIVVTKGLFEFLNEDEFDAVIAHELGHIIHRDFIVMTIASTLLQILYEISVIFLRTSRTQNAALGRKGEKKGGGVLIGIVAYIFYIVGTYLLLFLSRLREYYADEFSAQETKNPNALSSALIKIAYGIAVVPDTEKTARLLNNTRATGIFDFKSAKDTGLVYQNAKGSKDKIEKALLFDIVNPWAWILQLKSTHPVVGKRVHKLNKMAEKPAFDFDHILNQKIDWKRMWKGFFTDLFVKYSIGLTIIGYVGFSLFDAFLLQTGLRYLLGGVAFVLLIIFSIITVQYKYPMTGFKKKDIIDCMSDIYASPIRGQPIELDGKAIGRGRAGYVFGEDIMFMDKSGIMYLNYESPIPLFGNFFFGWKKVEKLMDKPAVAQGWFLRGVTHHLELHRFNSGTDKIKSAVRMWTIIGLVITNLFYMWIIGFIAGSAYSLFSIGNKIVK